jgi:hypothetical protein
VNVENAENVENAAPVATASPLKSLFQRLIDLSVDAYYNPYQAFVWPAELPPGQYWMSPELLSIAGTPSIERLSEAQLLTLARWEAVNFLALSAHGIRELLLHVLQCVHTPGFEDTSEYFHHFIGEENEHMWFFAQFCNRYGGKLYPSKRLKLDRFEEPALRNFLAFGQILIFEEIGDFYNRTMERDERLPAIVQQINRVHHEDESRHMAMGRHILKFMYQGLQRSATAPQLAALRAGLSGYMQIVVEAFYNPSVYADAGLPAPHDLRRELLAHPARARFHHKVVDRIQRFLLEVGIFEEPVYAAQP